MARTNTSSGKRQADEPAGPPAPAPAHRVHAEPNDGAPPPAAAAVPPPNNSNQAAPPAPHHQGPIPQPHQANLPAAAAAAAAAGARLPDRILALRDPAAAVPPTQVRAPTDRVFSQVDMSRNAVLTLVDQHGGDSPFIGPAMRDIDTEAVRRATGISFVFLRRHHRIPNQYLVNVVHRKNGNGDMRLHTYVLLVVPANPARNTAAYRQQLGPRIARLFTHGIQQYYPNAKGFDFGGDLTPNDQAIHTLSHFLTYDDCMTVIKATFPQLRQEQILRNEDIMELYYEDARAARSHFRFDPDTIVGIVDHSNHEPEDPSAALLRGAGFDGDAAPELHI